MIRNFFGAIFLVVLLGVLLFEPCGGGSLCWPPTSRIIIAIVMLYVVVRAFMLRGVSFAEASTLGKIEIVIGGTLGFIALAFLVAMHLWDVF